MILCEESGCIGNSVDNDVYFDFSQGRYLCETHHTNHVPVHQRDSREATRQSYGHPTKKWLTKADVMQIKNRVISKDDNHTVIDKRTGKETQLIQKHR